MRPMEEDELNVNGALLRANSTLAALRAGCAFYGVVKFRIENKMFPASGWSCQEVGTGDGYGGIKGNPKGSGPPLAPVSAEVPSNLNRRNIA